MTELNIIGLGMWSTKFSNWCDFSTGVNTHNWSPESKIQPALIPLRERRRVPQFVKMAIEVMGQACEMASLNPANVATVFSSSAGDMQIKDYLCRTLSSTPRMVSPTRFHNSVHNAATGYWSIATQSHAPASAVSAFSYSAPMALLEAAIQASDAGYPVLVVTQEMAAPMALIDTCPSKQAFSAALLLAPPQYSLSARTTALATVRYQVVDKTVPWPELPEDLQEDLSGNPGASLVPLLAAMTAGNGNHRGPVARLEFPLAQHLCLDISLQPGKSPFLEEE
jgi:hypothetical protein